MFWIVFLCLLSVYRFEGSCYLLFHCERPVLMCLVLLFFFLPLFVQRTLIGFTINLWVTKQNPPSIITRCYLVMIFQHPPFFFYLTFRFIYLFLLCLFGLCLPLLYQKATARLNSQKHPAGSLNVSKYIWSKTALPAMCVPVSETWAPSGFFTQTLQGAAVYLLMKEDQTKRTQQPHLLQAYC